MTVNKLDTIFFFFLLDPFTVIEQSTPDLECMKISFKSSTFYVCIHVSENKKKCHICKYLKWVVAKFKVAMALITSCNCHLRPDVLDVLMVCSESKSKAPLFTTANEVYFIPQDNTDVKSAYKYWF